MNTKQKLALQLSLFFAFSVLSISTAFLAVSTYISHKSAQEQLAAQTEKIVSDHIVKRDGKIFLKKKNEDTLGTTLRYLSLAGSLYDAKLHSVARYGAFRTSEALEEVESIPEEVEKMNLARVKKQPVFYTERHMKNGPFESILIPLYDGKTFVGIFQVGKDVSYLNHLGYLNLILMIIFIPCSILIGSILSYVTVKGAFSPLHRMLSTMKKIETHTLSGRIDIHSTRDGDIELLGRTFNEMMNRLEEGVRKQKQFIEHASHELKTPLAQAVSSLDVTLGQLDKTKQKRILQEIRLVKSDLLNLGSLLETLLVQAKLNSGRNRTRPICNVQQVWKRTAQEMGRQFDLKTVSISARVPSVRVKITADELYIIFTNLFSNAVKYRVIQAKVSVSFAVSNGTGTLTFADNGIGIGRHDLPHIFERFYRGNKSKVSGHGVGLSLVKEICKAYNLTLQANSNGKSGTRIVISGFVLDK